MKQFIRKLSRKGKYSYSLVIPREVIAEFGWRERQKLTIAKRGKEKLIVADWKPKKKRKK